MRLADETATSELAKRLAKLLRPGELVGLSGDLGSGKTAFVRGVVAALGGGGVSSPSYVLEHIYDAGPEAAPIRRISHWDLYRLSGDAELDEVLDYCNSPDAVVLIEWPERVAALEPLLDYLLEIRFLPDGSEHQREVLVRRLPAGNSRRVPSSSA